MLKLSKFQLERLEDIKTFSILFDIDHNWAAAIAMTESSLGINQLSPTGCKGIFQMSNIAMKDLLQSMSSIDDDLIDICCGIAFLKLLLKRHKNIQDATSHFCDPKDISFYIDKVMNYMKEFDDLEKARQTHM